MRFVKNKNNDIIAISHYRGKAIKGIAKCSPNDTYNIKTGEELAAARCNVKVQEHRLKGAIRNLDAIKAEVETLTKRYYKAMAYLEEVIAANEEANEKLENIEKKLEGGF